ncbi:hypothetical protein FIU97_10270 [Roseivivax sp. THAF40]|uniref:DUF192 domain-containing protein n=1 Tax=Roseivivax sp. THAF197b TaxID=2588299 RepID=UPI00126827C6|nr:DUF192 domain-containing protein [Roseivivax sp. THAF197b]QFS83212.1 hypothetical protein FIV09_10285 [Roseivivax sp. THAF197b]QFT46956.1 hypothetical protein FIU97_10270 [Roseivivax sp. THAF40]
MGKRGRIAQRVIAALALGVLSVTSFAGSAVAQTCSEDRITLRGDFGTASFRIALADTPGERSQGLMNVPQMDRFAGMLFVYEEPGDVAFWMRNTLIPLDMIFADETGTVRKVHSNAVPHDETAIPGAPGTQFVLEINGGLAETLGIAPGTEMLHPAIEDAAWPCAAE